MSLEVFGTGIISQSSTKSDLAGDYGSSRFWKGNEYRLFKAGGTIPAKTVCMFSAIDGTSGQTATINGTVGEAVVVTDGSEVKVACANATGTEITSGNYFWGLVDGYVVLTGGGSVTSGSSIMPTSSGGVLNYIEKDTTYGNTCCGRALENDGDDPYPVTCYFKVSPNFNCNAAT